MDASTIILGFTGSIGSGCSFIAKTIPFIAGMDYKYFKLSDIIRDILRDEGNTNPSVSELQDKGNELRAKHQQGYLVKKLLKKIDSDPTINDNSKIIVDGIKNQGEVQTLKQFPFFYLFAIHSDSSLRQKRYEKNGIITDPDKFHSIDNRDRLEEFSYGQQVKKCNYLSDIIILNNQGFTSADQQGKQTFIRNIYRKYVRLVELLKSGQKSVEHNPSVDELCMTAAYALSRMSSCLKRKVGAVIVNKKESDKQSNQRDTAGLIKSLPCIVSSGYNEVPLGSHKCIFHLSLVICVQIR